MRQYWVLVLLVCLAASQLRCAERAGSEEWLPPGDGEVVRRGKWTPSEGIHAVVNSMSFGPPPTVSHPRKEWSELPIHSTIDLPEGNNRFYLMLQGAVVSSKRDAVYADALMSWPDFKCSTVLEEPGTFFGKGIKVRRGPGAFRSTSKPHDMVRIILTPSASNQPGSAIPHVIHFPEGPVGGFAGVKWTLPLCGHSKGELKSEEKCKKDGNPQIKLVDYSFRQNRALLLLESSEDIKSIKIDTELLAKAGYRGTFRAQLFKAEQEFRPTDQWIPLACRDVNENCVIFEDYGAAPNYARPVRHGRSIGSPMDLSPEGQEGANEQRAPSSPSGEFLVPVGFSVDDNSTSRAVEFASLVEAGRWVLARVEGVFIFSGYYGGLREVKKEPVGRDIGGGGGLQDFQFRTDHIRGLRPAAYPNDPGWLLRWVMDFSVHASPGGYKVLRTDSEGHSGCTLSTDTKTKKEKYTCTGEWVDALDDLRHINPRRRYWIKFQVPEERKVTFNVYDMSPFGDEWTKTLDNCGALFVSVVGMQPPTE
ncbi:MAG: hypothetical protein JSU63_05755 [Phycisphaerales bacterium]|nr:MAG: hypothetical protein JSU63_05755 [Phycisphaerales bacterium]